MRSVMVKKAQKDRSEALLKLFHDDESKKGVECVHFIYVWSGEKKRREKWDESRGSNNNDDYEGDG